MDSKTSPTPKNLITTAEKRTNFFNNLEAYLAKCDGVDKLLKISRYASKIILSSFALPEFLALTQRLKSFESCVGVSRKAFRLGKFVQDLNSLRNSHFESMQEFMLSIVAYGGEGLYFFVEQFVWLVKAGLIDKRYTSSLQNISVWSVFVGYIGSVSLKIRDLKRILEDEACLKSSIEIAVTRGYRHRKEEEKMKKLQEKKLIKRLSIIQILRKESIIPHRLKQKLFYSLY